MKRCDACGAVAPRPLNRVGTGGQQTSAGCERRRTPHSLGLSWCKPRAEVDQNVIAILALVAFYLFQALAGRKKRQQASSGEPPPEPVRPGTSSTPGQATSQVGEMDEALAEIRRALGMGPAPEPAPPPVPVPTVSKSGTRTERAAPGKTRTANSEAGPSRTLRAGPEKTRISGGLTSDEFHQVVTGRPDFEERFEKQKSEWKSPTAPVKPGPAPTPKPVVPRLKATGQGEFRDPLRDHSHLDKPPVVETGAGKAGAGSPRYPDADALRRAFEDTLILGPPRAYKRYRD